MLSHGGKVMEDCEGHCQGDFWGLCRGGGLVGGWGVASESLRDWEISVRQISPFASILMFEIKISCYNYCSVRRPNSAKSIASHSSGATEGFWHQLFLSSTCSSGLQQKVMALLCDTCLLIDWLLESCQSPRRSLLPTSNHRKWKRNEENKRQTLGCLGFLTPDVQNEHKLFSAD